jgi:hydroxyacylglutathione hydrolase
MQKLELSEFDALALSGYAIVDTRKPEIFTDGFIDESVSIPFGDNFINSLQELISADIKVLIVADETDITDIVKSIKGSGMNNIAGYLAGGFEAWASAGNKFDMMISIDPDEFAIDYQFDEFYLIDVRPKEDFEKGHIEDAENIALIDLEPLLIEMETGDSYYLYGETAADAVTAGSLLKRNGFERVRPVAADYNTIKAAGIPLFAPKKKGSSAQGNDEN